MKRVAPIILFFAFLAGGFQEAYAGFGITPPYVRNDRLTRGSEFTQEIILVRGDPLEDLKAEVTVNVPGINDWFIVEPSKEFTLPKGVTQFPIKVTVRVPEDAPYDRYTGAIRIRTIPLNPGSGVSIALGAQVDVDIRVVDQIRDFEVKRVQLSEAEEPRRRWWLEFPGKIRFTMTLSNTGNAPVAPSKTVFEIYDKRGSILLERTESTNQMELVPPFATRPVTAELPTFLPPGAYLVKYSIYLKDSVKRTGELTLSVLPEGTLENYAGYGFGGLSTADKLTLIVPPFLFLLGIFAALFASRYLRRRGGGRGEQAGGAPPPLAPSAAPTAAPAHAPRIPPRRPLTRRPPPARAAPGTADVVMLSRRKKGKR